jgi:hypothetical protein
MLSPNFRARFKTKIQLRNQKQGVCAHLSVDASLAASPRNEKAEAAAAAAADAAVVPNTTRRRSRMLHPLGSLRSSSSNEVAAVVADTAPAAAALATVEVALALAPADCGDGSATPAACVMPRCTVRRLPASSPAAAASSQFTVAAQSARVCRDLLCHTGSEQSAESVSRR